jgi:hypothetical protein
MFSGFTELYFTGLCKVNLKIDIARIFKGIK